MVISLIYLKPIFCKNIMRFYYALFTCTRSKPNKAMKAKVLLGNWVSTCETVTKLIAKSPDGINRVPKYLCALCRSDGSVIYPYCDRQMAVQGKSPNTRGMQGQKCNDCDLINSTQAYVLIVLWYAKLWLSSGSKGKVMKTEDPIGTSLIASYQRWHYNNNNQGIWLWL